MTLSRIRPTTWALAVSAVVIASVGTYAGNSGFVWAGAIIGVVAAITAINQAMSRDTSGKE